MLSEDGADVAARARSEVRLLLAADRGAARLHLDRIGRDEIAAAAAAAMRLAAPTGTTGGADAVDALRRIVEGVHAPPPVRRFGLPLAPPPLDQRLVVATPAISAALERLAIAADAIEGGLLAARSTEARLCEAEVGLRGVLARLAALERASNAAARELVVDDPKRAASLRDDILPSVLERRRDVLVQLALVEQGRDAVRVAVDADESLHAAMVRARHQMVPALRIAAAAARAVDRAGSFGSHAAALDEAAARRVVDDMRSALGPVRPAPER